MPLFTLIILTLLCSPLAAQVTYVDVSATGSSDGTSWADAFPDLQSGLAGAASGEVWVARGTYHPGLPGDRAATFALQSGVAVYGGFDGTETSLSQRDVDAHPTILSGDIDDDDTYGAGLNWWQFGWTGSLNNSYHVVTGSGADATALLDGVTILAGRGDDPALRGGAGLLVDGGSPTFRRVTFQYNAVGYGSSAYLVDCASTFERCVIKDAYTCNCGNGGWTSGIIATGTSDVMFADCDFLNHYYVSSMSQGRGAALNIDLGARATLLGCRFIGNQTGNFYPIGGGTAYGAGVFAFGDVVVDRCEFIDNFAHAGAGLTVWNDAVITNSLFARNEAVPHDNGAGFEDGDYGAGLLTLSTGTAPVEVTNCTFVDNNSEKGAGIAALGTLGVTLRNTVIYDNYADPWLPSEDPVFILKQNLTGNYDVEHCIVEGLLQTEPGEDPPEPEKFPGCLDTSPLLVDMAGGDYRLSAVSPGIDAGDADALGAGVLLDLAGAPRPFDDAGTVDTGIGAQAFMDMGAYEFGSAPDGPWTDLGFALGGVHGDPSLLGTGPLTAGTAMSAELTSARESAPAFLFVGFSALNLSGFYGGTLVPDFNPPGLLVVVVTDPTGELALGTTWPAGIPSGLQLFLQYWIDDPAAPFGFAASNAVRGLVP